MAIERTEGPTAMILTRQGLPVPAIEPDRELVRRGAYVRREGADAVLVATGSEVQLAERAAELLEAEGTSIRVISMPCREAFAAQDDAYRAEVFPVGVPIASVEAAATFGWGDLTGRDGLNIGIDHFGASAPWTVIAAELGFTAEAVAQQVADWLNA
jgi:transketolase